MVFKGTLCCRCYSSRNKRKTSKNEKIQNLQMGMYSKACLFLNKNVIKNKIIKIQDPEKPNQKPYTQEYQVDLNEYGCFITFTLKFIFYN